MMSPSRLDTLAAKVAGGTPLTSTEALALINTVRALLQQRRQWPRPRIQSRLGRTARAGAKASPTRYGYARPALP
jgi:hypothetical protein